MVANTPENDLRIRSDVESIKASILDHLTYSLSTPFSVAKQSEVGYALALAIRDRITHKFISTFAKTTEGGRFVIYLSAEYLLGPQMRRNMLALGIHQQAEQAIKELGFDFEQIVEREPDPGFGSGGLGRLAACYLESMATLDMRSVGYGINYEFGIFEQQIIDGWQVEKADMWESVDTPWSVRRLEHNPEVGFEGYTTQYCDFNGHIRNEWVPGYKVRGIAKNWPIVGYGNSHATPLRLWKAEACEAFDFQDFNRGDYYGAVENKVLSENLSKVLYPNDEMIQGKALRLKQQYFLASCTLQELIHFIDLGGEDITKFHERYAIQLNDTHPALAIPELMRLLVDINGLPWDEAWDITTRTFAYTNHTLLPEALECWPVHMLETRLPRILEIIYEINARFLAEVRRRYPGDELRVARMSLIDEQHGRLVRMANLACVGSSKINGVSELHSQLLKDLVLKDFYDFYPEKFTNVTNGITPRRFLLLCNPGLSELITQHIGDAWITNLEELRKLEPLAENRAFSTKWWEIKYKNKKLLAARIQDITRITVDPESLFDIQTKRIHEYKRQILNVLHIITLYNRIKKNPKEQVVARTFIFGGKAAPGYYMAKLTIKLITSVAKLINQDADVAGRLKIVFFPNFNVKNSHAIYPAADLSEQISTAGKEASGTGNMKFSLNGALTIGTLDGANIEIREEVGEDNFFLFGLTTEEVASLKSNRYQPWDYYQSDPELYEAINVIREGAFSPDNHELFLPLVSSLLHHDEYLVLADYRSYIDCQDRVGKLFQRQEQWTKMSILNVARIGKFSSDRAVSEYCERIWNISLNKNEKK